MANLVLWCRAPRACPYHTIVAALARVHIVGGSGDIAKHLKEVHIRPEVVVSLLEELIARGFPGYDNYSVQDIRQRSSDLYGEEPRAEFIPKEVLAEIRRAAVNRENKVVEPWDKNATPAEPPMTNLSQVFAAVRPQEIVAERHSDMGVDVNLSQTNALGRFGTPEGTLEVQTGSTMLDQWKPQYLCATSPFTLALPVGGYDVWGCARWRRPAETARVALADLVRGLPRRIEGQIKRHWTFVPLLWNLYFRERVNS